MTDIRRLKLLSRICRLTHRSSLTLSSRLRIGSQCFHISIRLELGDTSEVRCPTSRSSTQRTGAKRQFVSRKVASRLWLLKGPMNIWRTGQGSWQRSASDECKQSTRSCSQESFKSLWTASTMIPWRIRSSSSSPPACSSLSYSRAQLGRSTSTASLLRGPQ